MNNGGSHPGRWSFVTAVAVSCLVALACSPRPETAPDPALSASGEPEVAPASKGGFLSSPDEAAAHAAEVSGQRIARALEELPGVVRARVLVAPRRVFALTGDSEAPAATVLVFGTGGEPEPLSAEEARVFVAGALGVAPRRVSAFIRESEAGEVPTAGAGVAPAGGASTLERVGPLHVSPSSAALLRSLLWVAALLLLLLGGALLWTVSRVRAGRKRQRAGS